MPITIRLRSPNGSSSLQLASLDCTLSDLKSAIHEAYPSIPQVRQDLRIGFPPKVIPTSTPNEATLESLGIKNGEPVILGELADSEAPRPPATKSAVAEIVRKGGPMSIAPSVSAVTPVVRALPPSAAAPSKSAAAGAVESVEVDGGYLVLRVVPDDNSCLFHAVGLVLEPGRVDAVAHLRSVVAKAILADPDTWSEAVLGRSPASYAATISQKDSWGGAIELSIFAAYAKREICSVDVLSGRVDRFGQGEGYDSQVLVVYSGIHYDALTFSFMPPEEPTTFPPSIAFDLTSYPTTQDSVVAAALKLVSKLRAKHAYTDTATFTLKCEVCGKGLTGEKEARAHAQETTHTSFGEYDG